MRNFNTQSKVERNSMVFLTPDTSLDVALNLIEQTQARALPVLAQGRYAGVVFRDDLMWYAPSPANTLSRWEHPELLAGITLCDEQLIKQVPQVKPHASLAERLRALAQSAAPVIVEVEDGRLFRIVNWREVLSDSALQLTDERALQSVA